MAKVESDLGASPVTFYCLYRLFETQATLMTGSSSPHSSIGSTGFAAASFVSQTDAIDSVDLEVITTDLEEEWEKQLKLKKHILGKFTKNMTYESGSIILLPTLVLKNKVLPPTKCYWSMLKGKDSKKYILCLISASESEGFSLFRYDMEKYSKRLESELLASQVFDTPESKQLASRTLANWYQMAINYIARTSLLLADDLDVIIHSCLIGNKIEVQSTMPAHSMLVEDALRLVEALQLPVVTNHDGTYAANDPSRDTVLITFDHSGRPQVDANETNEFCREWAARLVQASGNRATEAVLLRGWIEVVKMQLTQELNHIRKLCEAAVMDNYALYEAFLYLKHNPNKDVLLVLMMKQGSSDANTKEVLHTIFKCLTTPLWPDQEPEEGQDERTGPVDILM